MNYIIEKAHINENDLIQTRSFLIENSKVSYCNKYLSHYRYFKINAENFVITPGYVMIDFSIVTTVEFQQFKERMKHLQTIGCTTLITACDIQYESQFSSSLKKAKHALINSSIDYVVTVKLPLRSLTATLIRKCCRSKVPIVFLEITNIEEIFTIKWQRIREELFPYHCYLVPIWKINISTRKLDKIKNKWTELLRENRIVTESTVPLEQTPISRKFLLNSGLYPQKGSLQTGSDADYLLFLKERFTNIQANELFPDVVVSAGKIKKAGRNLSFEPGSGKELEIKFPRRFVPIGQAFEPQSLPIDYY